MRRTRVVVSAVFAAATLAASDRRRRRAAAGARRERAVARAVVHAGDAGLVRPGSGVRPADALRAVRACGARGGDGPTLRELWDGAALFVPPDEPEALVAALNALVENPALLSRLGKLARLRAEGYSAARMTAEYLDAYAGLLAASHPAAVALAS